MSITDPHTEDVTPNPEDFVTSIAEQGYRLETAIADLIDNSISAGADRIEVLLETLRKEPRINRRRPVFFEYTLMAGINDSEEDARRLPGLLSGIASKVNVIPMNPHPDAPYLPPSADAVDRFTSILHRAGVRVTLRRDRGRDIDAACGQLANRVATPQIDIGSGLVA